MDPLTEAQLRACFVNASRREAAQATLPDLAALPWERLDVLGWRDRRAPLVAYAVVPLADGPAGVVLRAADPGTGRARRRGVCAWCTDLVATDDVSLYVARRAGAPGRRGDTVGTLVCTDFACSAHVRRTPTRTEVGTAAGPDLVAARAAVVERRVGELRERSARFVQEVRRTA
ncbi:FBP domain-containing protein [Cellulomonas endophytica]|uniref:FBP domain-containing protein n=1 Tax=Cellulomonas endophytica TaxID=2494735 RepID=UPI0010137F71|nr:FBP domain-containing protein [Cellulomonas endophytica]